MLALVCLVLLGQVFLDDARVRAFESEGENKRNQEAILRLRNGMGNMADGELTVTADSTAWATQVRLLAGTLVRRVNAELGDGAVKRVKVRGPAAPRRPGQWRSRDSRGPRDTYG